VLGPHENQSSSVISLEMFLDFVVDLAGVRSRAR
jgi:hypothetical protein